MVDQMPIYVAISPLNQPSQGDLASAVRSVFNESDRHEVTPGAWFVRSPLVTSAQVRDILGIKLGGLNGVVVAVSSGRYTGVGDAIFVEKLQVWEGME